MSQNLRWTTIAVVSFEEAFGFSIGIISVDMQSCNLSGGWNFETLEHPSLENILHDKIIITSGFSDKEMITNKFGSRIVGVDSFILDASQSAQIGLEKFSQHVKENARKYDEYMAISPTERKLLPKVAKQTLVPMYANSWDISFDEIRPELILRQLGKRDSIKGTPTDMKRLITTSWAIKHLVDRWREDEVERKSRRYLYPEGASLELLPKSWMSELIKLK